MAAYVWYKTVLDPNGTALTNSVAVTIWFGSTPPPPGSGPYDLVIIDSDGDGLISQSEWQASTSVGQGGNRGSTFALFDFTPPQNGNLYTATPYTAGTTGLLNGLSQNYAPVDPNFLVICFGAGTRIETPDGPRAVETLAPGDLVITLDHGPQTIRSVWSGDRPGIGPYTPVRIAAGTLGATRDLIVSQNHRVLVRHPRVDLLFGVPEALVMAKSLVSGPSIRLEPSPAVTYVHLFLDRHEIVLAEGVPSETFFPGSYLAGARPREDLDAALFRPDAVDDQASACRPMLSHAEGRLLAGVIPPASSPSPDDGQRRSALLAETIG
jgi:hypothetical protein